MSEYESAPKDLTDLTWKIGGEAGWGIKSAGLTFSKVFVRDGYHVFSYDEYPSLVRGGHNCYQARIGLEKIHSPVKAVDVLVALDAVTFDLHRGELKDGALVIYDGGCVELTVDEEKLHFVDIPIQKILKEEEAPAVMMNNVALGASLALLDGNLDLLKSVIADQFADKGEEVISLNHRVAERGYAYVEDNYSQLRLLAFGSRTKLSDRIWGGTVRFGKAADESNSIILTGNEALALGAVAGGLKFFPAYPMTPASSILHSLAAWAQEFNLIVVQPEDEIAAVNMAVGAAYAGVRTMTATSGGGFCLMTEGVGLAGITETPLVVVDSQRPGPATGVPTWTEQGDLRFVLHAHQGSFPRIVVAPGDAEEAFAVAAESLNLAEMYQLPVIILIDKFLSESHQSTKKFDPRRLKIEWGKLVDSSQVGSCPYERYQLTEDGISPRALPGRSGTIVRANSDEHDAQGFSTEDSETRRLMMEKRARKLDSFKKVLPQPKLYGDEEAEITFLSWGTTKGPILEAQKILKREKIATNFLHFVYLNPFPKEKTTSVMVKAKKVLDVENNFDSPLASLIREQTRFKIDNKLLKYDGRPIFPSEIVDKVKELI